MFFSMPLFPSRYSCRCASGVPLIGGRREVASNGEVEEEEEEEEEEASPPLSRLERTISMRFGADIPIGDFSSGACCDV